MFTVKPTCYSNDLRMHNIYAPRLRLLKNTSRNPTHKQSLNSKPFQSRCKMDHFGPSFWDHSLQNHSVIREVRLTYLCLDFLVVCFRGYFVTRVNNIFVSMDHFGPTRRTATRKTCIRVRVIAHRTKLHFNSTFSETVGGEQGSQK